MLYIERQPSRRSVLLLVFMAIVLYLSALTLPELRASDEALNAAMARDMVATGQYLKTHVYGHPIKAFPMYPWLVVICSGFQAPTVFSLRLPSVLAIWGLALLCGLIARRMQSAFAGWISAAVVLTSVASFTAGIRAQSEFVMSFFLCAAWYLWFHFGFEQKRWGLAWGAAHFLVFLAILSVGGKALFWFYVPMVFMRRPLTSLRRMQMPPHLLSSLILALVICVWLFITPDQPFLSWSVESGFVPRSHSENYLTHLVLFPWKGMLYLGAWSLLIWSPFCIALRQFERNQPACLLFRTIVWSIVIVLWLFPGTKALQLLPVLGPVAILIGVHFEIVLRRYQHILNRIMRVVAWSICIIGSLALIAWLTIATGIVEIEVKLSPYRWVGHCAGMCLFLTLTIYAVWFVVLRKASKITFRSSILWCICGVRVICICTIHSWDCWTHSDRRLAGLELTKYTSPDVSSEARIGVVNSLQKKMREDNASEIYYLPNKDFNFLCLVETFYLGKRVVRVNNPLADLPGTKDPVYVLSSRVPAVPTRQWTPVSNPVDMSMKRKVEVIKSDSIPFIKFVRRSMFKDDPNYVPKQLLVYRGTVK